VGRGRNRKVKRPSQHDDDMLKNFTMSFDIPPRPEMIAPRPLRHRDDDHFMVLLMFEVLAGFILECTDK